MRESFLDKLRIAATCAVVLLHTITGVMDTTDMSPYPLESRIFHMILDLVCWSVPVFVMISGYLFLDPMREIGMGKMLKKYCRRIVLALFLFGVPYACMEQAALEGSFRREMLGNAFLMVLQGKSWSHMWYLYLILILYLLTPALRYVLKRLPRTAVLGVTALLFAECSFLPWITRVFGLNWSMMLPNSGIYLFYYICGYLFVTERGREEAEKCSTSGAEVGIHTKARSRNRKYRSGGLCLLLATGMVCSRLSGKNVVTMDYSYLFTVILSLLLFRWGMTWTKDTEGRERKAALSWQKTAALSFTVYLVHPVFLNIAYKALHVTPLSFDIGISLPLFFLGTLFLSVVTAGVLQKIPLLRKYVL